MKKIQFPEKSQWASILKRPTPEMEDIEETVNAIFHDVINNGDNALIKYTSIFDGVNIESSQVSQEEIDKAADLVSEELKESIKLAKTNIEKFHVAQKTSAVEVETAKGVICWQEKRPIQKVGLYIPGGTAPLFSTILMLAVPANIAGCADVIMCSPPNSNGNIDPVVLYTAQLCGVNKVFKVGGIQAVAAMTFGTETVPKVYKIFGPGNQYVTVAKQLATKYGVAIDMPAGPSELLVVADNIANAQFVAADLLSQAEHGDDSQVILVSTSDILINNVLREIENQIENLPRKKIAMKAISNSKFILVESDALAVELINEYAPEHYIICVENEQYYLDNVQNAGSVFIGNYTPESAGDYASGTNHTLPTNGFSKAYSGVNLDSFTKSITFQKISKEGIQTIGNAVEEMANAEGLFAHKNAITLRLNKIKEDEN